MAPVDCNVVLRVGVGTLVPSAGRAESLVGSEVGSLAVQGDEAVQVLDSERGARARNEAPALLLVSWRVLLRKGQAGPAGLLGL